MKGRRILVVEDDALIALMVEYMLLGQGCEVIGPAEDLQSGLALTDGTAAIDAAFLDVNLGGESVAPLAERLRVRGIPMVFATGYADGGLSDADRGCAVLAKPYREHELTQALAEALRRPAP